MSSSVVFVDQTLTAQAVSANAFSPSVNFGRCQMVAVSVVVTAASTPGTASFTLQRSLDNVNFTDEGSAVTVTVNGPLSAEKTQAPFTWYRLKYLIASGSFTSTVRFVGKGYGN